MINVDDSQTVEILKLIDSHLSEAVEADGDWADNLAPYDEDDTGVQTYYKMLQSLLLGPCEKLAKKRVEAIANGHNVAKYVDDLTSDGADVDDIKKKIDDEVKAAKVSVLPMSTKYDGDYSMTKTFHHIIFTLCIGGRSQYQCHNASLAVRCGSN